MFALYLLNLWQICSYLAKLRHTTEHELTHSLAVLGESGNKIDCFCDSFWGNQLIQLFRFYMILFWNTKLISKKFCLHGSPGQLKEQNNKNQNKIKRKITSHSWIICYSMPLGNELFYCQRVEVNCIFWIFLVSFFF